MTQKRLAFSTGGLMPLGIDDLLSLRGKLREPIVFPLLLQGNWVASTEFENLNMAEELNLRENLKSHPEFTVLALVKGGCLPSGLSLDEDTFLFPGHCTVVVLRSRVVRGASKERAPSGFLDIACDRARQVNPYAMEGTSGNCDSVPGGLARWTRYGVTQPMHYRRRPFSLGSRQRSLSRLGDLMPSKTRPTSLARLRSAQTQIALRCDHKCEAAYMRIYVDDQRCHEVARWHEKHALN